MKKRVFCGFAVFVVIFVFGFITCDMSFDGVRGEEERTNVIYGPGTVTILLDGSTVPVSQARALSQDVAMRDFEVFEVVFMNSTTVARAAWNVGEAVSLRNVPHGSIGTGVNYNRVTPDGTGAEMLSPTVGAAVLFGGRKNGTLQAVGRVIQTSNAPGGSGASIDPNTLSVTFGLSALVGDSNSFLVTGTTGESDGHGNNATWKRIPARLGSASTGPITEAHHNYHGHILKVSPSGGAMNIVNAKYTFTASAGGFDFDAISPALRLINQPAGIRPEVRAVRPQILTYAGLRQIKNTTLALITPSITTSFVNGTVFPLGGVVNFTINTGVETGVTSLYFQIPVNALTPNVSADGVSAITWYLRPGYEYNFLDIGPNGIGGSFLLRVDPTIANFPSITEIDFSDGLEVLVGIPLF